MSNYNIAGKSEGPKVSDAGFKGTGRPGAQSKVPGGNVGKGTAPKPGAQQHLKGGKASGPMKPGPGGNQKLGK
jgi:hypothetical protein